MKILFWEKNQGYNRAIVSSMTRKTLVWDMESCYKNISEVRNVTSIFQNFQKRKKGEKIYMEFVKSII